MRKILLIISLISLTICSFAQENSKQNEIGLAFYNFDNLGITFKTGTSKSAWRIKTLLISGSNNKENEDSVTYVHDKIGFGIGFGKEYKLKIADNLEILIGADISYSFSKLIYDLDDKSVDDEDRYREDIIHTPGFNAVFGFNYILNERIVIGAEILPNISYYKGKTIERSPNINDEIKSDISGINYGLSNSTVLLTLSYRF